jgi:gliding motility-associated-like protein
MPDDPADEIYNPGEADPRIFRPVAEGIDKYRLEIYNRWGELIFVSEDVNKGWNGYIKDSPVKQDVYVWRVTATFTNGRPYVEAGDVTVLVKQNGN